MITKVLKSYPTLFLVFCLSVLVVSCKKDNQYAPMYGQFTFDNNDYTITQNSDGYNFQLKCCKGVFDLSAWIDTIVVSGLPSMRVEGGQITKTGGWTLNITYIVRQSASMDIRYWDNAANQLLVENSNLPFAVMNYSANPTDYKNYYLSGNVEIRLTDPSGTVWSSGFGSNSFGSNFTINKVEKMNIGTVSLDQMNTAFSRIVESQVNCRLYDGHGAYKYFRGTVRMGVK